MLFKSKQFLLFIICSLFSISGYTQGAKKVPLSSFHAKRAAKAKQKRYQAKIATKASATRNAPTAVKTIKSISSLTTAKITTDLKGTIWINDKDFAVAPSETIEAKVPMQFSYYFISEDNTFISDLMEKKIILGHEKKTGFSLNLQMKKLSLHQTLKMKQQENNTFALKGLQEDMVLIRGGMLGKGTKKQEVIDHFEISPYEVTVGQFALFVEETGYTPSANERALNRVRDLASGNSKLFKKKGITWECDPEGRIYAEKEHNYPVIHVSYRDAVAFCKWLSDKDALYEYRLPTVAEWSYAAKGGNATNKYSWGSKEEDFPLNANIKDATFQSAVRQTAIKNMPKDGYALCSPVGSYAPNDYGLYDMTGNVAEWCGDIDTRYDKKRYIHKGGSYAVSLEKCTISETASFTAELPHPGIGFRVCRINQLGYKKD